MGREGKGRKGRGRQGRGGSEGTEREGTPKNFIAPSSSSFLEICLPESIVVHIIPCTNLAADNTEQDCFAN